MRPGYTRTEVAAALSISAVLGAVGVTLATADPSGRTERLIESLANLRAIGAANGQYRADNRGSLPLEMTTTTRRPNPNGGGVIGWTTWQFAGKNCSPFWFQSGGGAYDVEAADRPLNPYLYPGFTFTAPTPPARLPANDPARLSQQARVFRDPADVNGRQRSWPNPNNPPISSYDDVGTSYFAQMNWMEQLSPQLPMTQAFREGCRRLAADEGVDPARFLYTVDGVGDVVTFHSSPQFRMPGNHGGLNQGVALFADAHAALITFRPGTSRAAKMNEEYSVWFEQLGRPGGGPLATSPQRR